MKLTVVSNPTMGGSVSALPVPASNGLYPSASVVTLTALPSPGYVFDSWSGALSGTSTTTTIQMTTSQSVAANFLESSERYSVTTAASPPVGGSIVLSAINDNYPVNQVLSASAAASAGYVFARWEGDLSATDNVVSLRVDANKTISAVFNAVLTIHQSAIDDGSVDATPALNGSGYTVGTVVSLTAKPAIGRLFDEWTGDVSGVTDTRKASVMVVMDGPRTLTANFVSSPPLTVTAAAQDQAAGVIRLDPVQPVEGYLASLQVKAYALPNAGYVFSRWEGDATGTSPVLSLVVDGAKNVVAVFDPKVSVQMSDAERGSIQMTPPGGSGGYPSGTAVTVKAVPAKGYRFNAWGADLSGRENPTTIVVESPITVAATFVKTPQFPWLWVILGPVALFVMLIAGRLAYVFLRQRSED